MLNYEVMFVIDPALDDAAKEAAIGRVKDVISSEGEVTGTEIWGLRKLAYPIQKKNEGYYVVVEFKAEPSLPKELDRRFRISDDFMRHIIIARDEKTLEAQAEAKAAREAARAEAKARMESRAQAEAEEAAQAEAAEDDKAEETAPVAEAVSAEEVAEVAEEAPAEEASEEAAEEAPADAE